MSAPARTLVDLYTRACVEFPQRPAVGRRTDQGWLWITYADLEQQSQALRGGLRELGLSPGDRLALIADNRVEWPAVSYATMGAEAVLVPISDMVAPSDWRTILAECRAKVVIAARADVVDAIESMRPELPELRHVIGIDLPPWDTRSYVSLCIRGAHEQRPPGEPAPSSLAELVYAPDEFGALICSRLTHARMLANVRSLQELLPIDPDERDLRCVASVPWSNVVGRLADLHHGLASGVAIAINSTPEQLFDDLAETRPTRLVAGPALLRRIYHLVIQDVWQQPPLMQRMFHDGLAAAAKKASGQPVGLIDHLELFLDEELIFSRVREQLGGRLGSVLCSGALSHEVAGVLQAMHVAVASADALGPLDDEGRLVALVPARDEYHLAGGESILPVPVEEAIKLSPYVRDAMVYGEGRRYNVALIVPDADAVAELAQRLGVQLSDPSTDPAVVLLLAEQIRERLQGFPRHIVPRRFAVISEEFSVDNGMLSPTLELRRELVAARYSAEIRYLYATPPPPPRPRRPKSMPPPH